MKKIELQEKYKRKRRFTLLASLIIMATVILSLLQVGLSNRLASFSNELAKLEEEGVRISYENEHLRKEVASASAIATIAQKAPTFSFTSASKFLVIEEAESVAALLRNDGF